MTTARDLPDHEHDTGVDLNRRCTGDGCHAVLLPFDTLAGGNPTQCRNCNGPGRNPRKSDR